VELSTPAVHQPQPLGRPGSSPAPLPLTHAAHEYTMTPIGFIERRIVRKRAFPRSLPADDHWYSIARRMTPAAHIPATPVRSPRLGMLPSGRAVPRPECVLAAHRALSFLPPAAVLCGVCLPLACLVRTVSSSHVRPARSRPAPRPPHKARAAARGEKTATAAVRA